MNNYTPGRNCKSVFDKVDAISVKKWSFVLLVATILTTIGVGSASAQLSGTKTIGVDYATFNAAILDLNAQGVGAGGVIINVPAGYTETAPTGGFSVTATGTAANPIVFQKSGVGASPVFFAPIGGTATAASTTAMDGIIRFVGSDWVTIDGLSFQENGLNSGNALMEYGMGFYKASGTNGCNNNTIKNCAITLSSNNVSTSGSVTSVQEAAQGSCGILFANTKYTAPLTALIVTNLTGTNSNNKIYSNAIQFCNTGIHIKGYADTSFPFSYYDQSNDIGGNSTATANLITHLGGGFPNSGAIPSFGIITANNNALNVSNNTVSSSGTPNLANIEGIWNSSNNAALFTCNNNTVSIRKGTITSASQGSNAAIDISGTGSIAANSIVNITNNTITNCIVDSGTNAGANDGSFGIKMASPVNAVTFNVTGNIISADTIYNCGTFTAISYAGANLNANVNITGNQIFNIRKANGNQLATGGNNLIAITAL